MNSPRTAYLSHHKLLFLSAGAGGVLMALILAHVSLSVGLSFLIILGSLWLMQKAVGVLNLRVLSISGFCYLKYIGVVLVPSFFVYANNRGPHRLAFLFAVDSALLTIPLGVLLANRIFQFDHRETTAFFRSPMRDSASDPGPQVYFLVLGVLWIFTCMYVYEVRTIPFFYLLGHPGEPYLLSRLREESLKLLDSPFRYLYVLLSNAFYPFLIVLGFGRYLQTKRISWAVLFLASLISGLLYAAFTIAKAPVAFILLVLGIYFYLYRGGRVGTKFVAVTLILVLAFPLFVIMREYKGEIQFGKALENNIGQRVFYLPAEILYYYFEVFPHVVPYQHGRTIEKLAMLLGERPLDAANVVGRYIYPDAPFSITANAPFLGNLNADFGMAGVLLGGCLAGLIIQLAHIFVVRRGKSVLGLTIYANLMYELGDITATSLPVALLSGGPIFVLLLAWIMVSLNSMTYRRAQVNGPPRDGRGGLKIRRREFTGQRSN